MIPCLLLARTRFVLKPIDRRRLLVGSFNLNPFSLATLEALVEVAGTPGRQAGRGVDPGPLRALALDHVRGGELGVMRPPAGRGQAMTQDHTFAATSLPRLARKAVVAVIGLSVLGFGVALIILPGPAVLVIPLGLAILATEFLWARKLLHPIRKLLRRLKVRAQRVLGRPSQPAGPKVQL